MATEIFLTLSLNDETASLRLGQDIAVCLKGGDCLLLSGDLGAGKTTLARAIIRSFLKDDMAEVPSPTFTLVSPFFEGRCPLHHYDLYRISDEEELEELGFHENLEDGIALIEWPECAPASLPWDALTVSIEEEGEGRRITLSGNDDWQKRINRTLMIRTFLDQAGWEKAHRTFLQGDASQRSYEKVINSDWSLAVLMNWPERDDEPVLENGRKYSDVAHLATTVHPFVAIGESLRANGLPAPELFASDLNHGLLLMQDLGSETIVEDQKPVRECYEVATDILSTMHGLNWPDHISLPDRITHNVPHFDKPIIEIETSLLLDWYAPLIADIILSDAARAHYRTIWHDLYNLVSTGEKSWMLRDYHSPNLMWRKDENGLNRIGLIDYQDTLVGPAAYDVASLLQDARVTVTSDLEEHLKQRYKANRHQQIKAFDSISFERDYAIIAAQRGTRLLGLWPRLKFRDSKPHYMAHMPRTKDYLQRTLSHPVLQELKKWYNTHLNLFQD